MAWLMAGVVILVIILIVVGMNSRWDDPDVNIEFDEFDDEAFREFDEYSNKVYGKEIQSRLWLGIGVIIAVIVIVLAIIALGGN